MPVGDCVNFVTRYTDYGDAEFPVIGEERSDSASVNSINYDTIRYKTAIDGWIGAGK